jgi:uncharacterized RmlC-like cupin family protein
VSGYRVIHAAERVSQSDHGLLRGWGVSGETAGSQHLSMAHGLVPVGAKAARHYHPFETAIFVISGRARAYFGAHDEDAVEVGAGDFLYIPAGVIHSTENIGDVPVEYILARAAPEEVAYTVGDDAEL